MKPTVRKIITSTLFWVIVLSISFYFYYDNLLPYFHNNLDSHQISEKWWLIAHFSGAACTLFLGPLQFWEFFRNRFRKWHRLAGKVYIGGSIFSALMVFYLLANYPLPGSVPSLGLLALIWIFTTISAFYFALNKNFKLHKEFMIRSYVCGLAFLFIRLLPILNSYTGIFNFIDNKETRGTVYEWICWVYPLMLTELILIWLPSIKKVRNSKTQGSR
jgi:uncharacterized membrane protein